MRVNQIIRPSFISINLIFYKREYLSDYQSKKQSNCLGLFSRGVLVYYSIKYDRKPKKWFKLSSRNNIIKIQNPWCLIGEASGLNS
jgi:hypothetical protein